MARLRDRSLTQAQSKKLAALRDAVEKAKLDVYGEARHVSFNKCFKNAPEDVKRAYTEATDALKQFTEQMVLERRGWLSAFGHFYKF